jgi:hypothetical protein
LERISKQINLGHGSGLQKQHHKNEKFTSPLGLPVGNSDYERQENIRNNIPPAKQN